MRGNTRHSTRRFSCSSVWVRLLVPSFFVACQFFIQNKSTKYVTEDFDDSTRLENIMGQKSRAQPTALPLLPWEVESAQHRQCAPPDGIPKTCCVGSTSKGRHVKFKPEKCTDPAVYDRLEQYTLDFMKQFPPRPKGSAQPFCDVCQIADHLIVNNLTMSFQGDSMTRQTVVGLECELRRRGYEVQTNAARWKKRPKGLKDRKFGITDTVELLVSFPGVNMTHGNFTQQQERRIGRIMYYAIYRPFRDNLEVSEIVNSSDILIFDHGLHWTPLQAYNFREDMTTLIKAYKGQKNLQLVAWRETSAQHWNATGGHFSFRHVTLSHGCVPMNGGREGFRLPLIQNASRTVGMTVLNAMDPTFSSQPRREDELVILPFREYTNELHYLHPGECTHFCSSPYVWLPLWHSLRVAVDRALDGLPRGIPMS